MEVTVDKLEVGKEYWFGDNGNVSHGYGTFLGFDDKGRYFFTSENKGSWASSYLGYFNMEVVGFVSKNNIFHLKE